MARPNDWPERLAAFIEEHRDKPLVWSENDCATFCAAWVLRAGGPDMSRFGSYKSPKTALTLIKRRGFKSMTAVIDRHLVRVPATTNAKRGDIVQFSAWNVAVVIGSETIAPGETSKGSGLVVRPIDEAKRAWAV